VAVKKAALMSGIPVVPVAEVAGRTQVAQVQLDKATLVGLVKKVLDHIQAAVVAALVAQAVTVIAQRVRAAQVVLEFNRPFLGLLLTMAAAVAALLKIQELQLPEGLVAAALAVQALRITLVVRQPLVAEML